MHYRSFAGNVGVGHRPNSRYEGKESMKIIRAYLLFTSWRYRLGIFFGLPAAVLAGGLIWRHTKMIYVFGYMMITGIIFVETMGDYGIFNGIHSKRGYKLDFLKTSPVGPGILFQGLCGDLARRLLTAAVCIGGGRTAKVLAVKSGWAGYLGMVLAVYFAEVLGLYISRFTRSVALCVFITYGCIGVGIILHFLVNSISAPGVWVADGLLALAAAAMSLMVVQTGIKRWRKTYSDLQE